MSPELDAPLVRLRLGQRGDGGLNDGGVGGLEQAAVGELGDLAQHVELRGLAALFPRLVP